MTHLLPLKAHQYLVFARRNPWMLAAPASVRNYVAYRLTKRRVRVDPERAGPVFMTYSVTRRCNLHCRFCIVGDVLNKRGVQSDDATIAGTRRVFDHPVTRRCLYVMLTGGEPLLNPDLEGICRVIKAGPHVLSINTNGLLLPRHVDGLVAAGVDMLNVSHYDENAEALDAILSIVARRLHTKILKVIGRAEIEDPRRLEGVLTLARRAGCPRVFFANTYPHVDGLAGAREVVGTPTARGTEQAPITDALPSYAAVRRELAQRFRDVRIDWPAAVVTRGPSPRKTCRMPWYMFAVDGQGRRALCSSHASCTGPSIFAGPLAEVLNVEPWTSVRRGLLDPDVPPSALCRGCYTLTDPWRADM